MAAKNSNTGLRMMMAAASLVGFLGGWMLLGHAPKPGAVAQTAPIITTTSGDASLPSSQIESNGSLIQLGTQSSGRFRNVRLRTGGS